VKLDNAITTSIRESTGASYGEFRGEEVLYLNPQILIVWDTHIQLVKESNNKIMQHI
jgi:hypothetical protein